jgi:hypothetical protein
MLAMRMATALASFRVMMDQAIAGERAKSAARAAPGRKKGK